MITWYTDWSSSHAGLRPTRSLCVVGANVEQCKANNQQTLDPSSYTTSTFTSGRHSHPSTHKTHHRVASPYFVRGTDWSYRQFGAQSRTLFWCRFLANITRKCDVLPSTITGYSPQTCKPSRPVPLVARTSPGTWPTGSSAKCRSSPSLPGLCHLHERKCKSNATPLGSPPSPSHLTPADAASPPPELYFTLSIPPEWPFAPTTCSPTGISCQCPYLTPLAKSADEM